MLLLFFKDYYKMKRLSDSLKFFLTFSIFQNEHGFLKFKKHHKVRNKLFNKAVELSLRIEHSLQNCWALFDLLKSRLQSVSVR